MSLENNSEHVWLLFSLNFIPFLNCPYWKYIVPGCSHVDMVYFFSCYFRPYDGDYYKPLWLKGSFQHPSTQQSMSTLMDIINCIAGSGSSPPLSPSPLPCNSAVPSRYVWMSLPTLGAATWLALAKGRQLPNTSRLLKCACVTGLTSLYFCHHMRRMCQKDEKHIKQSYPQMSLAKISRLSAGFRHESESS